MHGVNATLVFNWCKLYRAGQLSERVNAKLLPVRVAAESSPRLRLHRLKGIPYRPSNGTIHKQKSRKEIRLRRAHAGSRGNDLGLRLADVRPAFQEARGQVGTSGGRAGIGVVGTSSARSVSGSSPRRTLS